MPKYIRRQSFWERIKSSLNPYDFLLWLSEELESNGWEQLEKEWAIPIGFVLNLLFLIARANTRTKTQSYDDVFGETSRIGWMSWLVLNLRVELEKITLTTVQAVFIVHLLSFLSIINAIYTFWRKRHYRLFESSIDTVPTTPSAHRVRVDSSPATSSPLRFLTKIWTDSAQARAHPDPTRDVWEVAIWDPLPISLRLFCYFSPGHILVYWTFLPTHISDARPSTTIATAIFIAFLLSLQLSVLQSCFSQQSKDAALISKEVLHEYDTKYVLPRTQPLYRDVGTQFSENASYSASKEERYNLVETFTPTVIINRGFRTNPNPNYTHHTDPDSVSNHSNVLRQRLSNPNFRTPAQPRESLIAKPITGIRQPVFRPSTSSGDGGSLGVYSHASSPLRKSASTNFTSKSSGTDTGGQLGWNAGQRALSPEKRMSVPGTGSSGFDAAARKLRNLDRNRRETGHF